MGLYFILLCSAGGTTLNKQNPDFETKSGFFVFIKHTKSSNNKYINPCPAM